MNLTKQIHRWFPVSFYCDILDQNDLNTALKYKALYLKDKLETNKTKWRCNTFTTLDQYNWSDDDDPSVKKIIEICREKVCEFSNSFGITDTSTLKCTGFWFNIAEQGAYQEYHQHSNSHFSLSYYLDVNSESGNIVFKSFQSIYEMFPLPLRDEDMTELSYQSCSYKPQNGMLLIFRSNILHMVETNQSLKPRISISMNFTFKEQES